MKMTNAQDVQAELEKKGRQRDALARQVRDTMAEAAEARRGLASGSATASAAAEAQTRVLILQDALRELQDEIAGLELVLQECEERAAREAKAREMQCLAALACEQRNEVDRLQQEAGQVMLELASRVLDAREALAKTRRDFGLCLGVHNTKENSSALQRAAGDILRSCGVRDLDMRAVIENYSGDRWSSLGGFQFAFEEVLRQAYRKSGTFEPQSISR